MRNAECGIMSLFNRGREIEIESSINPHSAFRIPLSPYQLYLNHLVSSGSVGRLPYISTPTR